MLHSQFSLHHRRRGAVAIFVAVCLIAVLGIVAIALDGGMLQDDRRQVQTAADAAALAAAVDLFNKYGTNQGQDPSGTAQKSALTTAAASGYSNGVNATITVRISPQLPVQSSPAITDPSTGQLKPGYAEVIIQYNQPRYFSTIWGSSAIAVSARAVARGQWAPLDSVGVLALEPGTNTGSDPSPLWFQDTAQVTILGNGSFGCNSTLGSAMATSGSGTITANNFNIVGGVTPSPKFAGTINTGVQPTPDPLADPLSGALQPPDPSTLPVALAPTINGVNVTLQPGIYSSGITVNVTGAHITFQPGTYYISGGGLNLGTSNNKIVGNGVTIYMAAGTTAPSPIGCNTIKVTPPTTGPLNGIFFYSDQAGGTLELMTAFQTVGNNYVGTIYYPGGFIHTSGAGNWTVLGQIIGRWVGFHESNVTTVDRAKGHKGRQIQLVE